MASQDKLVKALEALRLSITLNAQNIDLTVKKKDKVTNISIIADTICNTNIRSLPNFPNLLSVTIEVFLQLCDDPESDVRMSADECLNRIIRAMSDGHIAKIQVELHKEIKKNGSARTLRAALSRFAQLCHLIKPQKGKPYIQILVPCIVKIATRVEESVLETLDQSLAKIMTALGCFASDNEIKTLLRTFLLNISHISAVVRRTAANSMITICLNCRKPQVFITFVLNTILDLIIPTREDVSVSLLLGIFSCLRCFLPHTNVESRSEEMQGSFGVRKDHQNRTTHHSIGDRFIQVYELCLYYSVHNDHNVINAALETLHTLLDNPGENLLEILLSPKGISRSRITPLDGQINLKIRSLSEMSVAVSEIQQEESFLLSNVTEKLSAPDVENWIETSKLSHSELKDVNPTQSFDRLSLNNYYEDDTKDAEADTENRSLTNLDEYNNLFIRNINDNESDISNSTNRESLDIAHDFKIDGTSQTRKSSSGDIIDERASFKSTEDFDNKCDKTPCPFKDINIGEFTDEAIPLNYCTRHLIKSHLLTGYPKQLIPDGMVRVSVKSLALTCLSKIVQLYPDVLALYLDKSFCDKTIKTNINEQPICDIFLYANHHDPQIRGIVRILVASMLKSVLLHNNANYTQWLQTVANTHNLEINTLKLDFMIDVLIKGLEDESSTCNKQSLLALKICLADLLASQNSKSVIPILNALPVVVKNPYWLVKVQLAEVLQELPYITIFYVTGNSEFQDKVLYNVLYYLLGNDDLRVRNSAAKSIVRIIPHLFYKKDHPHNLPITAKTIEYRLRYMNKLLELNIETNMNQKYFLSTMPEPFTALHNPNHMLSKVDFFEKSLSRIINYLELQLLESESKYLTYGCCEALSILSNEYLTTIYNRAWNCLSYVKRNTGSKTSTFQRNNSQYIDTSLLSNTATTTTASDTTNSNSNSCSSGLLNICVALMTTSTLSEDISCQQWLLTLAGNIFSGLSIQIFKSVDTLNLESNQGRKNWDIYTDTTFGLIVEQLLTHVIRMLNIFTHVIDENTPVLPTPKTALPSLPNAPTLSPMKRKSKVDTIEKNKLISPAKILTGTSTMDKDEKSEKKSETNSKINTMGYFVNNPHYMKMYEILKTAYGNYKLTLDESASEKFLKLLQVVLSTLSQILEMCTIQECGRIAEEILQYLQSCVNFEAAASIQCVQQLLKCLFATNLCSQLEQVNLLHTQKKRHFNHVLGSHSDVNSFYSAAFQHAYTKFTDCLNTIAINKKLDKDDCSVLGYMRRKSERKSSLTFKSLARCADKASLASYIRLFEPMVIKSLKQYTVTSDVNLQCRVLQLLSQLVQLRVNYCLLDSDQIFIGFVLKQFEFIEEGQIPNADHLIPKIFNFLVHLSYENQHSKSIIVIPKIINLCDGLMASGQSPVTHCIPALRPVIIDVFLFRGTHSNNTTTELKELETTRDVLFSMLLRLVEYHDVLEMLTLVISDSRYHNDNGDRWIKWSKLVVDSVVPMLTQRRIRLDSRDAQIALHSLLCELHPNVYKAMDPLLLVLFQEPPYMESPMSVHHRWLGGILAILLTLSSVREEVLLFKINDIRMDIPIRAVYTKLIENYDPLNVTSSAQSIHNIPEEEIFARFMFRVFHIASEKCLQCLTQQLQLQLHTNSNHRNNQDNTNNNNNYNNTQYLIEQFSTVLLFCIHMFESGSHCKIAHTAMKLLHNPSTDNLQIPIDETNDIFLKLATFVPLLTFHWCYILTLLGYSEQKYWSKILQNQTINSSTSTSNNNNNHSNDNNKIENVDFDINASTTSTSTKHHINSINLEIVRIGGIILYSDYICENITDCENLTWFLVNHIESVIKLSNEFPVAEFVAAIHRNHAASGLFVQAVATRCQQFNQASFVNKLLKCLENVHPSQSGPLLVFLVPNLLNCKALALSRLNAGLASRRTELLLTMTIEEVTSQLSKEDLTIIMEILLQRKLAKKHGTFVSLLNKLASKYYDLSPLELDQGRTVNPDCIKKIKTDGAWFYSQVKLRCCQSCYLGPESAELLNKLAYDDIISIMSQKDFNKLILKDCISLLTLNMMDMVETRELNHDTPLLKASVEILMKQVVHFKSFMPKSHQVYNVNGFDMSPTETKYTNRLNELFSDSIFWQSFFEIAPSVTAYLELIELHRNIKIPEQNYEDLTKFSVLCLESITYLIKLKNDSCDSCESESMNIELNSIESALQCTSAVLKQTNLCNILASDVHMTWLCSSINSIYILVNYFNQNNEPLPTLSKFGLIKTFQNPQTQSSANACYQLSILIAWLEKLQKKFKPNIPQSIFILIRSIIVSLSRLPLVNSYVLTPPDVWEHMWQVELLGPYNTQVPPLPIEYLQEIEILEQFIFRVTLLGWVNRHQFEETWMCLLSVLSAESTDENHHADDLSVIIQANCLAVQAITSLLMQTLLIPIPGHPNVSHYLHVPREKNLSQSKLSVKKLKAVQNKLYWRYKHCFHLPDAGTDVNLENIFERPNLDRVHQSSNNYLCGQLSIEYLWTAANMLQSTPDPSSRAVQMLNEKEKCSKDSALDIHSCLQFLLDLYSQWIKPQFGTPLRLLNEVVRSMLAISDLFTEKSQFQWMLDVCLELSKTHPPEDEILHQYIVLSVCKAAAVLTPDLEVYEIIKRLIENSLKSGFLPERIACLHGLLYLLQSSVMSNTVIGGMSDEMLLIHPMAIDYIQYHITVNNGTLYQSEDHRQVMWALAFYLLEHVEEQIADTEIVPNVLQVVMLLLSQNSHLSMALHNTLLQGLERLIVAKSITGNVVEQVTKLAVDRLKHPNPGFAFPALQLLLACMYTEGENQINAPENVNGIVQMDPDLLVEGIEKISAIFDRIKKGYPFEAQILCTVLPHVLNDFFPPPEILTKVIGEFLSQQQPHPRLLSDVVFQIFERASAQNQLTLLQDWVVFSLSNFTQCLPIGMATWCLICFFISASTNHWLRALFPHVQSRIGKYEYEDRKMLCISGADFYRQLTSDVQKNKFRETFESVVNTPGTPFKDLLLSL